MSKKQEKSLKSGSFFGVVALGAALLIFPGCDWIKNLIGGSKDEVSQKAPMSEEHEEAAEEPKMTTETNEEEKPSSPEAKGLTLLTINGKPALNESEFNQNVNQMLQANPYFKGASADVLPAQVKRKLFDEITKQKVIVHHAKTVKKIDQTQEFKKAYTELTAVLRDSLLVQLFEKDLYNTVAVNDNEVEKYFNDNKERFVKKDEEVTASGVKFKTEDAATKFMDGIKKAGISEFEKLAKAESDASFVSFGSVSKHPRSFNETIPAPAREAIFALKKYPAVEKVKAGKEFWVVTASDKKAAEYFALDDIKPQIASMLKNEKFRNVMEQSVKDIKSSMQIVSNEDYFKEKEVVTQAANKDAAHQAQDSAAAAA